MENSEEDNISSNENTEESENDSNSETEVVHKKRKLDDSLPNGKNSNNLKLENGKRSKSNLRKPPTAEEMNLIKETETLFHSNLFRLQMDELLKEVKVKESFIRQFDEWYKDFGNFLKKMPEYGEILLGTSAETLSFHPKMSKHQRRLNRSLSEDVSDMRSDRDVKLRFIKPTEFGIFGLYKINSVLKLKLIADINITIPKCCFLEKDYLNNRYFVKRLYYLLYIHEEIAKTNLCASSICSLTRGCMEIIPHRLKMLIRIHVTPPEDAFKLMRCIPSVNNVRPSVLNLPDGMNQEELSDKGTPYYNALLGRDLTLISNSELLEKHLTNFQNIQDGIKLLSVWLDQRNLYFTNGSKNDLVAHTLLYLIFKGKITQHMSSYQVIRNFWVFLSTTNWHEEPISLCENVSKEKLQEYRNYFPVVFLDKSGFYNLTSFLYLDVYLKIRSEAELAVKFLDNAQFDSFRALFLTKMPKEHQYDALVRLSGGRKFKQFYNQIDMKKKYTYYGCFEELIVDEIISTLKIGLNKRVTHIVPILNEYEMALADLSSVTLGITLNPSEAMKVIEKGPIANTAGAETFRKFWGDLAECRRFADGAICEAVYFKSDTIKEKRQIFKKMIDYIAKEKLKMEKCEIFADVLEKPLILNNLITPFPTGTAEEATLVVITNFDELSKIIRDFNLPLEVVTIQSTSEVISFTAPFPPIPTNFKWGRKVTAVKENNIILKENTKLGMIPRYVEPIDCVIQLSMNSKWPKSLEPLRQIKIEFYLQLSKLLEQSQILSNVKPEFLEVFYKGLVFRFQIYHPKEVALLKRFKNPDGMVGYKDNKESLEMEKRLNILPKFVGALNGIQSQYSSYGPSTALIKRWLRSQLIDEYYIPNIVVDLLNASLFINPAPYMNANLPQVAFLRFLKYVAEFDFNSQFVLVNFNRQLNDEMLQKLETDFSQNREKYPPLYIITPYDNSRSLFSKSCTKEILNRLSLLASTSYKIIHEHIKPRLNISEFSTLFQPNLEGYHLIIHLRPFLNSKRYQSVKYVTNDENKIILEEYTEKEDQKIPVVAFNPIEKYLHELRESYGNFALFFHDSYGGDIIGVIWQPKALETKEFRVSYMEGRKLAEGQLILNKPAIIEDFRIIGDGLVKDIECE